MSRFWSTIAAVVDRVSCSAMTGTTSQANVPQPKYSDRFNVPIPCDRCNTVATWTLRYRYPGTGWLERHACNRHRRHAEDKIAEPLADGATPIALQRISRLAF